MCRPTPLRCFLTVLFAAVLLASAYSQNADSSLHGMVRDTHGKVVANAEVQIQSTASSQIQTAHSNSQGNYSFTGLQEGVYSLRARAENATAEISSLFISRNQSKAADLTLTQVKKGSVSDLAESAKFFDEPNFTVSAVTDTTNLGGHGSDTIVRTRDTLAKETASLGKASSEPSVDETSLRKSAEELRGQLAQHETADLHHQLADIDERLGDSLEAVGQYQRAAAMNASEAYLFDWGSELLLHHAPEPALEVFSRGNRLFPHSARMLVGQGAACFTQGDSGAAAAKIVAASDLAPNDPVPYLFLGKMQAGESASSPEVLDRLHRFVTLQPENPEANYYYALALSKSRGSAATQAAAAEIEFFLNKAISLDPKFAPAYLQLGILHSREGDQSAAIASFQRTIECDPHLEEAHYRLAQVLRLAGQSDRAKNELQIYQQLSKQSAERDDRERHEIPQFVYTLRDQPGKDRQ